MEAQPVRIIVGDTIHRGFRSNGVLFSAEADNLDSAKEREVLDPHPGRAEPWDYGDRVLRYCERCFGERQE